MNSSNLAHQELEWIQKTIEDLMEATENKNWSKQQDILEKIREKVIAVSVSYPKVWMPPSYDPVPNRYRLLLHTGQYKVWIEGRLDWKFIEPQSAQLFYKDPLGNENFIKLDRSEKQAILAFACKFNYRGEY